MKKKLSTFERQCLAWSPEAKAVRDLRNMWWQSITVRCPYNVRFGDWVDGLTINQLYIYYSRLAHGYIQAALQGDHYTSKRDCIRYAKQYLAYAAKARVGDRPTRRVNDRLVTLI